MRIVSYDLTNPDSIDEAQKKLQEYVKAIDEHAPIITPVQVAENLQSLSASREEQLRSLFASLSAGISNLQEGLAQLAQEQRNMREAVWASSGLNVMSPYGFNFATGQPSAYQPSLYQPSIFPPIEKDLQKGDQAKIEIDSAKPKDE